MVNRLKANVILERIENYIKEIEEMKIKNERDLRSATQEHALAFLLQQVVMECINLGNHVVSSFSLGMPSSYKELFTLLHSNKVIKKKTCIGMHRLVEIRNRIAHAYGKVSKKELVDAIKELKHVRSYAREVIDWLERLVGCDI